MKFSLARGAIALAATLTLASCGGGKATFPINVSVSGVQYPGLVLSTNGMDLVIDPPATAGAVVNAVFPNEIEYGQTYDVVPKGQAVASDGTVVLGQNPKHQTCNPSSEYPYNLPTYGTAGQLAKIQVYYVCSINAYSLSGVVKGLTTDGLVLTNGSNGAITVARAVDANSAPTGADVAFAMNPVVYNNTYGVTVLTQPTGQTCTVANGVGIMDDTAEAAGGINNLVVTCVNNPS